VVGRASRSPPPSIERTLWKRRLRPHGTVTTSAWMIEQVTREVQDA